MVAVVLLVVLLQHCVLAVGLLVARFRLGEVLHLRLPVSSRRLILLRVLVVGVRPTISITRMRMILIVTTALLLLGRLCLVIVSPAEAHL